MNPPCLTHPVLHTTNSPSHRHYWLRNDVSTALGGYFRNESDNPLSNWNILFMSRWCFVPKEGEGGIQAGVLCVYIP